jgi:hypothetical protein
MPRVTKQQRTFDRKIEPIELRRKRQRIEGAQAMAAYIRAQEAARDQLSALRAERLARESK